VQKEPTLQPVHHEASKKGISLGVEGGEEKKHIKKSKQVLKENGYQHNTFCSRKHHKENKKSLNA